MCKAVKINIMTANEVYQEATRRGIHLRPKGDKLQVYPANKCPEELLSTIRKHKAELITFLDNPPGCDAVPPDDLPLVPEMPTPSAEDRELMLNSAFMWTGDKRILEWLVRREAEYFDGPGGSWDCNKHAYAAARDLRSWQLRRSEKDVLRVLQNGS